MERFPRLVNLRRCARAQIADTGEATNTTVALTNNSNAAELLLVWLAVPFNMNDFSGLSYQKLGPLTTLGATPIALVPGDAPPPGVVSKGDQPSQFTPDWQQSGFAPLPWPPGPFPFAVLLPGWSLVAQDLSSATQAVNYDFWWEAIRAPEFERWYAGHVEVL